MRHWHTTEVIHEEENNGLDYDMQTYSNCDFAHKKLSDKRPWRDIVQDNGWGDFYQAVKTDDLPKPVICPIVK